MSEVRVRFAPSPTGFFHIGSARTALFNWLYAKHTGGKFILRIEDTDKERNTEEALQVLLEGMRWLGLDWDEGPEAGGDYGPYFQSERQSIYDDYLKILKDKGRTYEKDGALWFRLEGERYTEYDEFHKAEVEKVKNAAVVIEDAIRGRVERAEERDFVIVRSNGEPVFHFVNVVDDIAMGITHVIRGEDHLSNTSKHVELFKALGAEVPVFAHIPLILKQSGPGKMSKRDEGALIEEYEQRSFIADAVRNYICLLGWSPKDDQEKMSIETIIERFDFAGVNKGNARFDETKLSALNAEYIRELAMDVFAEKASSILKAKGINLGSIEESYLLKVLELCQGKIKSMDTLFDYVHYFFQDGYDFDAKGMQRIQKGVDPKVLLGEIMSIFENEAEYSSETLESSIQAIAEANERKIFAYFPVIRMATSGLTGGPDLLPMLSVMGRERVLPRLQSFLEKL
ncbi:MAG: glutamate--tRNA ligase family protein [Opitutae bacterium]|nr:glutamate--tRNA ligase family protein [Opitutae bacterium]